MMVRPALILVVDDEAIMRELLGLHLRGAGYRVVAAEDAIAAGHRVLGQVPDLIVCDFKMPYMNGNDFIGALRGAERQDLRLPAAHQAAGRRRSARHGAKQLGARRLMGRVGIEPTTKGL